MIRNYFKIAWRNLGANKLFTTLNVAGLAIGICVCIILFTYVSNELGFDRMYKNSANIYRVNMETSSHYDFETWATLPNAVGPAIVEDIPQVKSMSRLIKDDFGATASLKVEDKDFTEKRLYLADSAIFKLFDFNFIEGNSHTAFSKPKSIVVSQSAKKRLFNNESALGRTIIVNNRDTLQVTGVYKDLPHNSVIDCNMIYNIMDSWMGTNVYWSNASYETYCLLEANADVAAIQKQATALIDKNVEKSGQYFTKFLFQPLTKIHLYSSHLRESYTSRQGNISTVKSLLFLSLLVLLIACINYMNLATANSRKRTKSIGMNKVLGANKRQMLFLFYMETAILTCIAIVIGYAAAFLGIPLFERITGNELHYSNLYSTPILISLLVIWATVTLIAGSYPAISMSNISPLALMNKSQKKHRGAEFVRKGLVVFQFAASIILIIAVSIILQQMDFIKTKDLGYKPEGVVALSVKSAQNQQQIQNLINALERKSTVKSVSAVQTIPGDVESGRSVRKLATDTEGLPVNTCRTYGDIIETMQLKLLAGNELPTTIAKGDSTCYTLINEAIISYLGYKTPEEAVGKSINTEFGDNAIISGVIKDFNYKSVKDKIGGYMYYKMTDGPESVRTLLVRYNTKNLSGFLQDVQKSFNENLPNTAFAYQFLDKYVENLYLSEQRTANTATVFSLLAIFIACLGLFGLAAFTAEERTKEIGIRKVLGATVSGVTKLLTKDFLKLVLIAFAIAVPVAWWLTHKWLMEFAYRTQINWWVFVIAGIIAMCIALITISFQAIKTAIANPVDSLRNE
ncbi:ABC transporter permease [Aequorivita viscosa]|nr:ABC transporter permease [Aequorivita viscosa]